MSSREGISRYLTSPYHERMTDWRASGWLLLVHASKAKGTVHLLMNIIFPRIFANGVIRCARFNGWICKFVLATFSLSEFSWNLTQILSVEFQPTLRLPHWLCNLRKFTVVMNPPPPGPPTLLAVLGNDSFIGHKCRIYGVSQSVRAKILSQLGISDRMKLRTWLLLSWRGRG